MYSFEYRVADSVAEAVATLQRDDEAKLISGGMTLLPTMKLRLAAPSQLIDLTKIGDLNKIEVDENNIVVGATTTHSAVALLSSITESLPALSSLAIGIGDAQVRNRGTIGGSVANNDPAADYPAALLALKAEVQTDRRTIPADDFFTDMFETALDDDEIVCQVSFQIPQQAVYLKFPNPASRYAIVGVFLARFADEVRVGVTGAAGSVFRHEAAEAALNEKFHVKSLHGLEVAFDDFNQDLHASAQYRGNLVDVLTRRAVLALT